MTDNLNFSIATVDDAPQIVEINNSYVGWEGPGGFLVVHLTLEEVLHFIETGEMTFYCAKDNDGLLLGYAEVASSMDLSLLDNMTWDSDESRELALSVLRGKYVYVKQLAVRQGHQRKGVAEFIYRNMERTVGCPVVVFAANKPRRNEPSIRFHEKMGYQKVSRLYRPVFGEFTDYESFFFIKLNS